MSMREMTRLSLSLVTEGQDEMMIYLVEDGVSTTRQIVAEAPTREIVAEAQLRRRGTSLPAMTRSSVDLQAIETAALNADEDVLGLDDMLEESDLGTWAAFRNVDARGAILDAAYTFVSMHVAPRYAQASIEIEDEIIAVMGDGDAVAPPPASGRPGGSSKAPGRTRPKRAKKLKHDWF